MSALLRQALGYGLASAIALLVDMGMLWLLVAKAGWPYLIAASTSFLLGAIVAYGLSIRLAFTQHRLASRRVEFLAFLAIGGTGLALNALIMALGVAVLGLHYLFAKCVAAGFTFSWNFFVRRQMLFVRRAAACSQ